MTANVRVQGSDYAYAGELVGMAIKKSGAIRYIVEDHNGRLFVHNGKQLGLEEITIKDGYLRLSGMLDAFHIDLIRELQKRLSYQINGNGDHHE
jgi:hypothetical protein